MNKFHPLLSSTNVWSFFGSVFFGLAFAIVAAQLARVEPRPLHLGGTRGEKRRAARRGAVFAQAEPLLRFLADILRTSLDAISRWSPTIRASVGRTLEFQRRQLIWAGEPWGLDGYELIAIGLFFGVFGSGVGVAMGNAEDTLVWVLPLGLLGLALPNLRLQSVAAERFSEMTRELPAAIDLTALAMNAGSDLPGAVRRVIEGQTGVVAEELSYVLKSLDLGITRAAALLSLRDRVPVQEVRDLVRAVVLAEKKGASITEALSQQARSSRQRRSVRAEEAAARAGVLLLIPLMFLMGCIMILLVGPLLSSGASL